jgi:hydrogenase maturation protein HypF
VVDWTPMMLGILDDVRRHLAVPLIAQKFHNTLCEMIVSVARRVGEPRVVLSGGCFQNKYLTERAIDRLRTEGFQPYWHQRVPPNDGGVALGQVYAFHRSSPGQSREARRSGASHSIKHHLKAEENS